MERRLREVIRMRRIRRKDEVTYRGIGERIGSRMEVVLEFKKFHYKFSLLDEVFVFYFF